MCKWRQTVFLLLLIVVQPPTGVALVATGKSTARVTWNPVNKVLLYQVSVTDNSIPNLAPVIKTVPATSMDISNLEPCSTFTVGVSSVNAFLDPGEPSNIKYTTSSEYLCKRLQPLTSFNSSVCCRFSSSFDAHALIHVQPVIKMILVSILKDSLIDSRCNICQWSTVHLPNLLCTVYCSNTLDVNVMVWSFLKRCSVFIS